MEIVSKITCLQTYMPRADTGMSSFGSPLGISIQLSCFDDETVESR